jgi:diguanylate cyclase (GGDEF)-like protein
MNTQPNKNRETGLYDEQVFKVLVEYELSRAQRYPSPVTMLHISLNLSDARPESAESIRKSFGDILNTSLRASDIPAYYGEDFLVLMPSTDENGAQAASRRLIARSKGTRSLTNGNLFKFNIHIGIATHPGGRGASVDKLLQQAEAALQEARKASPQAYKVFSG